MSPLWCPRGMLGGGGGGAQEVLEVEQIMDEQAGMELTDANVELVLPPCRP